MVRYLTRLLVLFSLLWAVTLARGAETGTLRGTVRDAETKQPMAGVTVNVEGPALPGGRSRVTDERGAYWFPVLPPGDYRLTYIKDGYQPRGVDTSVKLDQTTTIPPMDLAVLTVEAETIEVIESAPVIDNTQSAIRQSVTSDYMEKLPVARSYQGVIRTLPGVSGRIDYADGGPSDGNPSVRGEGQYGNNYLLEGFSIRDPLTKTSGLDLPFEALEEISVFTDGAPAEFGNFTGMIANVSLKSGENEAHGSLGYNLEQHLSFGQYEIMGELVPKRQFSYQTPTLTLGGPIVKDKLWFFTVLDYRFGHRQLEGATQESRLRYDYMFLTRFTYSPFSDSNTLFNFTVQKQGSEVLGAGANAYTAPEATTNARSDVTSLNANFKSVLSPFVVLEAKWNRSMDTYRDELIEGQSLYTPSHTDIDTGYVFGNVPFLYQSLRERQGFAIHMTRFVTDWIGQHIFKGGFEYHITGNTDDYLYTGGLGVEEAPAYLFVDVPVYGENGEVLYYEPYLRRSNYNVGALGHQGRNQVLFLQDQWQPVAGLTVNLGLRADNEILFQNAGLEKINQWVVAPRFGLAWDVTQDAVNLISANAGRYYDVNGLRFVEWADTRSSSHFTTCYWDENTQDYTRSCYTQDPVANPLVYGSSLRPYYMDKFTLGYTRALPAQLAIGVKGIVSTTRDIPEDAQFTPYHWEIVNPEIKRRDYWGLELSVERRLADNWQVLGSLTYSRARGTNPGNFETGSGETTGGNGNEVGVFMDDIADPYVRAANDYYGLDFYGLGYNAFEGFGQTQAANAEGWYGYLPYHSFINLKINGSYRLPWGTELGLIYELDSGHAWQRRGIQDAYGDHNIFPEGRGARFMPPVHYIDLRVAQEFKLPRKLSLKAELTVLNLLDLETPVSYYENYNMSADMEEGDTSEGSLYASNPLFGQVLYRQAPRSVRGNLTFRF